MSLLWWIIISALKFSVVFGQSESSVIGKSTASNSTSAGLNISIAPFRQCFQHVDIVQCLHDQAVTTMDAAIDDNSTWHLGEFLSLQKNPNFTATSLATVAARSAGTTSMWERMTNVLKSRRLQFQTDLMPATTDEGRKKKNKNGGIMMFGGLALAAVFAQVVMGKVAFVAAAALVLAKIALFVSTTSSLKKQAQESGGSGGAVPVPTEHIVYSDHGHGGGGSSHDSYQRRFQRPTQREWPNPYEYEASSELRDRDNGFFEGV